MIEPLAEIVGGVREKAGMSYSLSVAIVDGALHFTEEHEYYARGGDEGRTFLYGLSIPIEHFERVVAVMIDRCARQVDEVRKDRKSLLVWLLIDLASRRVLAPASTAGIKENLLILQ